MRRVLSCIFIALLCSVVAQAKLLSFADGYVETGDFKVTKSVTEGDSYIDVTYHFGGATLSPQTENGIDYCNIEMPNAFMLNDQGYPSLPYYNDKVIIESTEGVSVSVLNAQYNDYKCSRILPAKGIFPVNSALKKTEESAIYTSNALYPSINVQLSDVNTYRSVPFASVNIYPILYNPVARQLRCFTSITYRISYQSRDVSEALRANPNSLDVLESIAINPEALAKFGLPKQKLRASNKTEYDYIIVTTPKFEVAAQKLSEWKTMLGLRTKIIMEETWTPRLFHLTFLFRLLHNKIFFLNR